MLAAASLPLATPADLTAVGWEDRRNPTPPAASRSEAVRSIPVPTLGTMLRPAPGAITGPYMERRGSGAHPGIDFDGDTGDPVRAAAAGTVALVGPAPAGYSGYGNIVLVDHGGGIATLYAHLSRMDVHVGQRVEVLDVLGGIGATGHATGSHLHFEVRIGGQHVNPGPWLAH